VIGSFAMDAAVVWREVYNRFDPERVAREPLWRVDRTQSPLGQIVEALDLQNDESRVLLLGTVGSGKSTELLKVAAAREPHEFVILLDLARHFTDVVGDPAALVQVAPWEVCFLVGVAAVREARERIGLEVPEERVRALEEAWRKLADAAHEEGPREVDVVALGRSLLVGAGVALAAAGGVAAPTALAAGKSLADATRDTLLGTKRIPFGRSSRAVADQDERARSMLSAVNGILHVLQGHSDRRVLVLLDGLDRVTEIERARALLVDSSLLGRLECSVVMTGPYALRHRMDVARVRLFKCVTLVNEPVLAHDDPASPGPGVGVLRDMFDRRVRDLDGVALPPGALDRLAYFSGGRARDFVKLVRAVAAKTRARKLPAAGAREVEDAVDEMRRLLEFGMTREHTAVLEDIAADPEHALPDDERARELLVQDRLLPYPNRSEWFFPHPLLTIYKVTRWKPGSPA